MELYPLKLEPIYKQRIWGGRNLSSYFGRDLPGDILIGESWELADLPDDKSKVSNGYLAGSEISMAIEKAGQELTGRPMPKGFELLVKFLDANDDLSVQVHPDDQAVERMGEGAPKTECWYIIDSQPGSVIYKGVKPGTTREEFEEAIKGGTVKDYLCTVPVRVGECHFLPSGTVHAIGKGLLIAEIQQPSDTTYRVFDWNRVDKKTKQPRQLHIPEALESINFDITADSLPVTTERLLVDAEEFRLEKFQLSANSKHRFSKGCAKVMIVVNGAGMINPDDKYQASFSSGQTFLIPASLETEAVFESNSTILIASV